MYENVDPLTNQPPIDRAIARLSTQHLENGFHDPLPIQKTPENVMKYPKYFRSVVGITHLDVYGVHKLFDVNDPSGCIQHASKKLLLSGVRTGGKSAYEDIKEARDTLNRWLELNNENNPLKSA